MLLIIITDDLLKIVQQLSLVHGVGVLEGEQEVEAGEPGLQALVLRVPQTRGLRSIHSQYRVPGQHHTS